MIRLLQIRNASTQRSLVLGIRREDKNRWERRVPLVPSDVARLTRELNATVLVQPSTKRIFSDDQFKKAGAHIAEDLSPADVIVGVKEVPVTKMIPNKTFVFFSHTYKGQPYNMPMLKHMLDNKIRLVDYELMKGQDGKRLVLFSRFAGYAGMIDALHGIGQRLLGTGFGTPFLSMGMSYMYSSLADARLDVMKIGQAIKDEGLPRELGPMTFVFTGSSGNVTGGALHIFNCLPHEWVSPNELKALHESKNFDNRKVYGCLVDAKDYLVRKDGQPFNQQDYFNHPEKYASVFHETIAPYTRMLINGIFWAPQFPRFLTIEQTRELYAKNKLPMLTVADISCDIRGPIEFMSHASTIDHPFFMYDPVTNSNHQHTEGRGIQIMSIDNLPTEMPLEASQYFSASLYPHVAQMLKGNFDDPVIQGATMTTLEGKLTPKHAHLTEAIKKHAQHLTVEPGTGATVSKSSKVLLLGSGYVASPLVDYLLKDKNTSMTIASNIASDAKKLCKTHTQAQAAPLDIKDQAALRELVSKHDVVVSFVPAMFHPVVAQAAIDNKKHMVTASYISPEMAELDQRAKQAGITILNELGLDPGLDHLTAMKTFHEHEREYKLTSFVSWCGGLPAPEASDNPLGYKFSWSPRGVLLAALNSAKYLKNKQLVEIPGNRLMESVLPVEIYKGFALEGIANRDSIKYKQVYGLSDDIETLFRGTLRYKGYGYLMSGFRELGLLDARESPLTQNQGSWIDLIQKLVGAHSTNDILTKMTAKLGQEKAVAVYEALRWLSCFQPESTIKPAASVLDTFCALLEQKLQYGPGERDMVIMQHEFGFVHRTNGQKKQLFSTLVSFGDVGGYSAMAKTVGLPAAMGTEMLLKNQISQRGVIAPVTKDIYEPMLRQLERESIQFKERVVFGSR